MTTYYVSTSGDNGNAGTSTGTAWRTLQYAADNVTAGDTVKILPGNYDRFTLSTSGTSGNLITFEANDAGDHPYIRTAYHAIADTATGSNAAGAAAIYLNNADYVTLKNLKIDDERAPGVYVQHEGRDTYNVTLENITLTSVVPVVYLAGGTLDQRKNSPTISPIWIVAKGRGYKLRNLVCKNLTFVDCSCRRDGTVTDGNGTEILTIKGEVDGVLVEGCTFSDCIGINLNFLGVDETDKAANVRGQPRNIVCRNNTFIGAIKLKYNSQDTVQAVYFDRGTGPAELYGNLIYCPDTMAMMQISFEPEALKANLVPTRNIAIHDNVIVSGRFGLTVGTYTTTNTYTARRIGVAHNVILTGQSPWDSIPMRFRVAENVTLRNNVIANYAGNDVIGETASTTAMAATWEAQGNVTWTTDTGNAVEWGPGNWMTVSTFNANIQSGTGWTSKPVFSNGISAINTGTDLTSYALADWTLAATSPGYKAALPVTYANGAGSSATEITVDNAAFFAPGIPGLGISGTTILIAGTEAEVVGVDYENNVLSLDAAYTWTDDAEIRYKPTTAGVYSVGITSAASVDTTPDVPDVPAGNLLANGYFTAGDTAWYFSPGNGAGNFDITDEAATLQIVTGGSTCQLYQFNVPITSGTDYTLTIYGSSANAPQTVTANVILHASPYTNLGLSDSVEIGSTCAAHTLTFTATGTSTNARMQLVFPDAGALTLRGVYLGASGGAINQCPDSGGGAGETTTQTLKVAASLDDWGDNSLSYFGTTDQLLAAGGDKDVTRYDYRYLARFAIDTTITTGDNITAATLRLYRTASDSGAALPAMRVYAVDSTNSSRPADATASKAQTLTTAYVDYSLPAASNGWYEITGLATVIQELLDSGTLTAGNYITIVVADQAAGWGGTNDMQYFRTYDYSDGSLAAELMIESTTPSTSDGERAFGETFSETFAETFGGW